MENIEKLKEQNRLLIERLNANQSAIDSATDSFKDMQLDLEDSEAYVELLSQLAPNEELLKSIEDEKN
jgi:hypothetical protein